MVKMAPRLSAALLLLPLLFLVSQAKEAESGDVVYQPNAAYVAPAECDGKCLIRCSETSHHKPCMFFCNKCCQGCHCVPSGTYGNKDECPCYRDWKTKEGTPKCP